MKLEEATIGIRKRELVLSVFVSSIFGLQVLAVSCKREANLKNYDLSLCLMNKINFSIDSLLGLDTNEINTEYEKQSGSLEGSAVPLASPASTIRSEESQTSDGSQSNGANGGVDKPKGPFCAKCKLHSEYYPVKNHKDKCKRRYCDCNICKLIDEGKSLRGKKKIKMLDMNALQHLSKGKKLLSFKYNNPNYLLTSMIDDFNYSIS